MRTSPRVGTSGRSTTAHPYPRRRDRKRPYPPRGAGKGVWDPRCLDPPASDPTPLTDQRATGVSVEMTRTGPTQSRTDYWVRTPGGHSTTNPGTYRVRDRRGSLLSTGSG